MPSTAKQSGFSLWRLTPLGLSLVGWICLVWLMLAPSESGSAVFFGYSLSRLVLALTLLLPSATFTFLTIKIWRDENESSRVSKSLACFTQDKARFWLLLGLGVLLLGVCWLLFFLPEKRAILWFGSLALYLAVAKPILVFGIVLGLFASIHLLVARYGFDRRIFQAEGNVVRLGLLLFSALLLLAALIAVSDIGLGFDASVWNAPGTPVLVGQVLIALLYASLLLAAGFWLRKRASQSPRSELLLDLGLALVIWILTTTLWLAQPAPSTYYDTPPIPPNYQSYPLSDAFNHDVIANNVLIGEGFRFGGHVAIRRPVYVLFLAGLEGLLGSNYEAVVVGQVALLALFPSLLYLLGAKLHNRFTGVLLAGIVAFREANSIILGDVINTSHAKLLMADLPTALLVAGFTLALVSWLRRDSRSLVTPLLVGGLLGWSILLRSQSLTLLPFVILLALLVWGWKLAWRPVLLFMLGVLLVASPWIVRNRVLMGQWAIEDAVVSGFLANRYSFTPGTFGLPFQPRETEGEYYARQMAYVRDFTLANPFYVAGFVADNFVRNQLLNFLAVPVSLQWRDLESHVRELPYWPGWQGELVSESYLPIAGNLFLVSLGIAVSWKRYRWAGLAPLFINIGFTLNLALARVSGWRYNLPVDWTVLLYYAIGIAQLLLWGIQALNLPAAKYLALDRLRENTATKKVSLYGILFAILMLGLLGSSFLLIEAFSTPRYSSLSKDEAIAIIEASETEVLESERQQLLEILEGGQVAVSAGRALHPRFYGAGEGETESSFLLTEPMEFARITFFLVGPTPTGLMLRTSDPAIEFPASSDVIVFRCADKLEAAGVIVQERETRPRLYISADLPQACEQ